MAHGPFDRTTGPCPFSFWDQVTALLCKFPPTVPILVLGDGNAHVGSCLTSAIGDVCPEQEIQAGEAWHQFLLNHDLAAFNTHATCHRGSSSTWFSPHGTGRRLDFVAGPSTWVDSVTTWVEAGWENLQTRDDHLPLVAHLQLQRHLQDLSHASSQACYETYA